ncbi:Dynamin-like protein ARC5 [Vitis vinifera]|uniref:Dynamin-like protein ARC5 n=1 Tax=Vitis vinifera TaxID=29760 RepID=A0A438J0H1_VITVI|nr:Dynamin-like protein ARC5 [Vitis vinifera]
MSQRKYALDILEETSMLECKLVDTPMDPNSPCDNHWDAVIRILRYIKGIPDQGMLYEDRGHTQIVGYTDADWAGSPLDRSSAEAEYQAMTLATCELIWLRQLLQELRFGKDEQIKLVCDNQVALHIASNPVFYERTKHIEVDCHFIREKIASGCVATSFVNSNDQLADIFTKSLRVGLQVVAHIEKVASNLCLSSSGGGSAWDLNLALRCMEDLVSTTRYVTWSLHNKVISNSSLSCIPFEIGLFCLGLFCSAFERKLNRAGLRQFLDSFGGTEQSAASGNSISAGLAQESSFGSVTNDKQDIKPKADVKLSHLASGIDSATCAQTTETRLADLLDNTLWNRRLAPSSERIVYALVQQIFHGIREYFLASVELKFNCFLLMPVVDKLPALLREDLESAFEDDLDSVFDITNLRHSLGVRKRDTEIELKRIQRLKEKFRQIHEQLCLHQVMSKLSPVSVSH